MFSFRVSNFRCTVPAALSGGCAQRGGSLAAGGGIGKARTRANDAVTCSVSDESAPPLAPNCSLHAGVFLFLLLFVNRS